MNRVVLLLLIAGLASAGPAVAQNRGPYMAAAAEAQQAAQPAAPPPAPAPAPPAAAAEATPPAPPASAPAQAATPIEWCKGAQGAEAAACARMAATYTPAEIDKAAQAIALQRAQRRSFLFGGGDVVDNHFGLGVYTSPKYETRGTCAEGDCSGPPAAGPWRHPYLADFGLRAWYHPLGILNMRWVTLWIQGGGRAGSGAPGKDAQWSAAWAAGIQFSISVVSLHGGFAGTHTRWATGQIVGGASVVAEGWEFGRGAVFGAALNLGRARVYAECEAASRPGRSPDGSEWSTFSAPCGVGLSALIY